jgi:peptide deformylase
MIYELLKPTEPLLRTELPDITFEELKEKHNLTPRELYDNLIESMQHHGGIGLSANQCGLPVRAFVMFTDFNKREATIFFNPKITWQSEDTEYFVEGCLTYPFVFLNLKRPLAIRFSYTDIDGVERNAGFSGLTARIFQHEYDHMDGKNFTQLASRLKLDMAKKKIKKVVKTS